MHTLLRFKYLASRRNNIEPLVVWTVVILLLLIFVLVSFVISLRLFQGRNITQEQVGFLLLFAGILLFSFNASRLNPLNQTFARELEYFASLPLHFASMILVELAEWVLINILFMGIFLFAPLAALAFDRNLPFSISVPFWISLLTYSGFLLFAGGWLHILSLRKYAFVIVPLQISVVVLGIMGFAMLPIPGSFQLPATWRMGFLRISNLPIWPSTWTAQVMSGQFISLVPLLGLTGLLIWRTLPGLSRYWELEVRPDARPSLYPLTLLFGSGWAVTKYMLVECLVTPELKLAPKLLSILVNPLFFWWAMNPGPQFLWLLCLFFTTQFVGRPVYSHLIKTQEALMDTPFPVTSNEFLRGSICVLGLMYLPAMILTVVVIGASSHLSLWFFPGVFLGLLGIVVLAVSSWRRLPSFWGFIFMGVIEVVAALLL